MKSKSKVKPTPGADETKEAELLIHEMAAMFNNRASNVSFTVRSLLSLVSKAIREHREQELFEVMNKYYYSNNN